MVLFQDRKSLFQVISLFQYSSISLFQGYLIISSEYFVFSLTVFQVILLFQASTSLFQVTLFFLASISLFQVISLFKIT